MLRSRHRRAFLAALLTLGAAWDSAAATFTVNSTADGVDLLPGDGLCASVLSGAPCTLRAAVQEANALPGEDRVLLPAAVLVLAPVVAPEELARAVIST